MENDIIQMVAVTVPASILLELLEKSHTLPKIESARKEAG